MEFQELIEKRESVRKFTGEPVSREDLQYVLEAGRKAPTAKNLQPQKIYVVESAEGLQKIDEVSPCRYGSPCVLLICGDTEAAWQKTETYNTAEMDSCIVTTHMMLAATDCGLGSIWVGRFDDDKAIELFDLPENIRPICLLPIGHIDPQYPGSVNHHNRKDLKETVEYL